MPEPEIIHNLNELTVLWESDMTYIMDVPNICVTGLRDALDNYDSIKIIFSYKQDGIFNKSTELSCGMILESIQNSNDKTIYVFLSSNEDSYIKILREKSDSSVMSFEQNHSCVTKIMGVKY